MAFMPYIDKPPWARRLQRTLFTMRYVLLGVAGGFCFTQPSMSFHLIGTTLILSALSASIGVITGRFQLELVPLWFIGAALSGAAGLAVHLDRPISAVLVIALLPALAERLLHLMLVASKARRLDTPEVKRDGDH